MRKSHNLDERLQHGVKFADFSVFNFWVQMILNMIYIKCLPVALNNPAIAVDDQWINKCLGYLLAV